MEIAPLKLSQSNFKLGFLFLPKPKRDALSAVYAFCRHVDDLVDDRNQTEKAPVACAQAPLAFWKEEVLRLYEGRPTHPISQNLAPAVRDFSLPQEAFLHILEGVGMDLRVSRYETFEELESYLFRVASAVGFLSIEIFGYRPSSAPRVREYARLLGYAFQMTNILRDVGVDLSSGRVYLPQEDLRRFKCSLNGGTHSRTPEGFAELMRFECERARDFYRRAREQLPLEEKRGMLPGEVMASVYENLLSKIEDSGFDVLHRKITLSGFEKLSCAWRAWRSV